MLFVKVYGLVPTVCPDHQAEPLCQKRGPFWAGLFGLFQDPVTKRLSAGSPGGLSVWGDSVGMSGGLLPDISITQTSTHRLDH